MWAVKKSEMRGFNLMKRVGRTERLNLMSVEKKTCRRWGMGRGTEEAMQMRT